MRRGASFHAAGRSLPGTSPQSAPTNPSALSRFSTPNLSRWPLHLLAPGLQPKISNRHLVRLEITTTSAESTSSLFLIDPNHADCSHQPVATRIGGASVPPTASASRAASAAEAKFVHPISNRHLVKLEIVTTRAESTTSLFLIDPKRTHFSRANRPAAHSPSKFPCRQGLKNRPPFRRISGSGNHPHACRAGERPPRLGGRTIGSTADSGSAYPGSSPGLPANFFSAVNPENALVLKAAPALNSAPSCRSTLPYTSQSAS
jgi:hypothetical protein